MGQDCFYAKNYHPHRFLHPCCPFCQPDELNSVLYTRVSNQAAVVSKRKYRLIKLVRKGNFQKVDVSMFFPTVDIGQSTRYRNTSIYLLGIYHLPDSTNADRVPFKLVLTFTGPAGVPGAPGVPGIPGTPGLPAAPNTCGSSGCGCYENCSKKKGKSKIINFEVLETCHQ